MAKKEAKTQKNPETQETSEEKPSTSETEEKKLKEVITEEEQTRKSLTMAEMRELQWLEARVQLQITVRDKHKLQEEILNRKYQDDLSVLRGKINSCNGSIAEIQAQYNASMEKAEARLQVKLSDFVIQDDGTLVDPGPQDDPTEEPPTG